MKIYIVTSGEYSNYGIEAVFTDKKLAQAYVNIHYLSQIEEYETDITDIHEQYLWIAYDFQKDCVQYFQLANAYTEPYVSESFGRIYQFDLYPKLTPKLRESIETHGIKSELMLKIARDTFAEYLAQNETSREQLIKHAENEEKKFERYLKHSNLFFATTSSKYKKV